MTDRRKLLATWREGPKVEDIEGLRPAAADQSAIETAIDAAREANAVEADKEARF